MNFDSVAPIAEALLYEGYLLYPYRSTSVKNRQRWTFGCLLPPAFPQPHGSAEGSSLQTECLLLANAATQIEVEARFLHLTARTGAAEPTWHEAVARTVAAPSMNVPELARQPQRCDFAFPATRQLDGDVERCQQAIAGTVLVSAAECSAELADRTAFKLCVRLLNLTPLEHGERRTREEALAWSLISCHLLLGTQHGEFLSLLDPPEPLQAAAASCQNLGVWPVLVGDEGRRQTMLASPIILYDYPKIAPASPGDLFDGTEIDEMLTLRIRTLTDAEKLEMARLDPRARHILQRSEALPNDKVLDLHGTFGPDQDNKPKRVRVGTVDFEPGMRVRLRPRGRADAFDLALAGMTALIVSIEQNFENEVYVSVVIEDDPGKDFGMAGKPGHRFYFRPDEVEPLPDACLVGQAPPERRRILIAGIGNIFFGDDAFGVEVVRRLAARPLPAGVVVKDFGIRGFDLACALQDGYETAILVDAVRCAAADSASGGPGTLHVLEPQPQTPVPAAQPEMHHLDPAQVFDLVRQLGGQLPRLLLVGCEPASLEPVAEGMASLSEPVQKARDKAVELVERLVASLTA